jgi:hypothetical protein
MVTSGTEVGMSKEGLYVQCRCGKLSELLLRPSFRCRREGRQGKVEAYLFFLCGQCGKRYEVGEEVGRALAKEGLLLRW